MLKKQVRILGMSGIAEKRNKALVVGVVFRGNSWLDGAFAFPSDLQRRDHIASLAKAIMKSKQYSQLHAVTFSRTQIIPSHPIDIVALARRLKLPVIAIAKKGRAKTATRQLFGNRYDLLVNGKRLSVFAKGIDFDGVSETFRIACKPNFQTPEAARCRPDGETGGSLLHRETESSGQSGDSPLTEALLPLPESDTSYPRPRFSWSATK